MERENVVVVAAIKAELHRQSLTVRQLSEGSGIPMSVLTRRLAGRSAIDVDELDKIAGALGVPVAAFTRSPGSDDE